MKFLIILTMVLFLSALFIISNNNISFKDSKEVSVFFELWINWNSKIFSNIKEITGNVIRLDWKPE